MAMTLKPILIAIGLSSSLALAWQADLLNLTNFKTLQQNNSVNALSQLNKDVKQVDNDNLESIATHTYNTSLPSQLSSNTSIASQTLNLSTSASPSFINHSLPENDARFRKIHIDTKHINGITDYIYKDALGREALFRGWNVSGSVKLKSTGFKPFLNVEDAKTSFTTMRQNTGANQVRFTLSWEGVHPDVDVIDYAYLDDIIAQMREAMQQDMHIVLDYHSDLYSRHTFTKDSIDTGNGAPEWIVKGGNHGTDDCGLPCLFTWSAHKLSDSAVRSAMRAFWLNAPISTDKGTRYVQTEFLWQLGKVSEYLNQQLTAEERDYLMGIEPLNEPFDGGIKALGLRDYSEFDNLILWPFYKRVRSTMSANQLDDKLVFAEPLVFWNTNTGVLAPTTGWGYLKEHPGKGFVFSPHFYDQGRMGVNEVRPVDNGSFFESFAITRDESRFLKMPLFIGEYGMWTTGTGVQDTVRMTNGIIQALETTNQNTLKNNTSRYADFYSPFLSGTQWHWDYNYGYHHDYVNDNPDRLVTEKDAWNNEDFSVIKDKASTYTQDINSIERIQPRRTQGDLLHFAYNSRSKDREMKSLDWLSLRVSVADQFLDREFLRNQRFAFLSWQGRHSDAPTELFLPRSFEPQSTVVITERDIVKGLTVANAPRQQLDEILLTIDPATKELISNQNGHRLAIWDDKTSNEDDKTVHFAVVIQDGINISDDTLIKLQQGLIQRLQNERQSPVYLASKMTESYYPKDLGNFDAFQMIDGRSNKCMEVQAGNRFAGTPVQLYSCNGSTAQRWTYENQQLVSQLDKNMCLTAKNHIIPKQHSKRLVIKPCKGEQNQQFVRHPNWGWALKSNPNLRIDAFGTSSLSQVGLWTNNKTPQQQWRVQY